MADNFQEEMMITMFLLQNTFSRSPLKRKREKTNTQTNNLKEETIILGEKCSYHISKDN